VTTPETCARILRRRVRDYAGGDDDIERELAEASGG